jgi:deazaflavin-dependent oxidoreductase (nitroreductase family)
VSRSPRIRRPPTGLGRALFRLPITLYRARLGWLLGDRILLIEHIGRSTGRIRRTVVEVVDHDRGDDSYVVASGFGTSAQWYRNLLAHPQAVIMVGRRRLTVDSTALTPAEGGRVMARYAERHPRVAARLCRFLGYPVHDGDYRTAGERIPFLRLRPRLSV